MQPLHWCTSYLVYHTAFEIWLVHKDTAQARCMLACKLTPNIKSGNCFQASHRTVYLNPFQHGKHTTPKQMLCHVEGAN